MVRNAAFEIVYGIYRDISGRKGLGDELGNIDNQVKNEMLNVWYDIVTRSITPGTGAPFQKELLKHVRGGV